MSIDNDSPATRALFSVAIEAEEARESVVLKPKWHATVDEMLLPSCQATSPPFFPGVESDKKGPIFSKGDIDQGKGDRFKKTWNPIKTIPPPKAVSVSSATLSARIDNLQNITLIGKWYFPEMSEDEMRLWLSSKWLPLIGYTPIISRLMKDWFSFHFQKISDLEMILNKPWVVGRSFLFLSR